MTMLYMNDYDIEVALNRFRRDECPNLLAGAEIVDRLRRWTDANSDGWAFWPLPVRAARKLMELLQTADHFEPTDCTEAQLKAACVPIKAFLTKQGVDHALVFPTLSPGRKYVLITETTTITREYLCETDLDIDTVRTTLYDKGFRPLTKAPFRVVRADRQCDDIRPAPTDTKTTDYS